MLHAGAVPPSNIAQVIGSLEELDRDGVKDVINVTVIVYRGSHKPLGKIGETFQKRYLHWPPGLVVLEGVKGISEKGHRAVQR